MPQLLAECLLVEIYFFAPPPCLVSCAYGNNEKCAAQSAPKPCTRGKLMDTQDKPLAVVTGASSEIGLELAKEFARH